MSLNLRKRKRKRFSLFKKLPFILQHSRKTCGDRMSIKFDTPMDIGLIGCICFWELHKTIPFWRTVDHQHASTP
jgi:hypothetical protein